LEKYVEVVHGEIGDEVELIENGVKFVAPILTGQKTGWFFDHRPARARLQQLSAGKRVLDVFSYIGGWGIQAAVAGASEVVCVDSSEKALDWVEKNAALNGVADHVGTLQGNAAEAMQALLAEGEKFDIVIVDPPAFIKRKKIRPRVKRLMPRSTSWPFGCWRKTVCYFRLRARCIYRRIS
jgi:23S rRNA (cytosine1962-C5)-methyltransferase